MSELHASQDPESSVSDMRDMLLRPLDLGDSLHLPNRIVLSPMTRCFAGPNAEVGPEAVEYYARRAEAGLMISEPIVVRPDGRGYPNTPELYTREHIHCWRAVTDEVHRHGGRIFAQLWHVGRVSHPRYQPHGGLPIAPSPVALRGTVPRTAGLAFPVPRMMDELDITSVTSSFAETAANAFLAGFDGVELQAGDGYLIDQFLHCETNRRQDRYGGSVEAMTRFCLQVVDAVMQRVGSSRRVGVRLSPAADMHMQPHPQDAEVFRYLLLHLQRRQLAYIFAGTYNDFIPHSDLRGTVGAFLRRHYDGVLAGGGSYSPASAAEALEQGRCDLIGFGRLFLANPDLVPRLRDGRPLRTYNQQMLKTLY
jgi:2,4-dienoyl-CoA reductase-like NADH-dependent reductase (Old Yellow Enzyme family)